MNNKQAVRFLIWINFAALGISMLLLGMLLLRVPDAIVANSRSYKTEVTKWIEGQPDLSLLKQRARLELSYLVSSNDIARTLLYAALCVAALNSVAFTLNLCFGAVKLGKD